MGILTEITRPETGMAVWTRSLAPCLVHWLRGRTPLDLPGFRLLIAPADWAEAAPTMLPSMRSPKHDAVRLLADEIGVLAGVFAGIAGCDLVDIRLEWIIGDACWKFHRDCVTARMLMTLRGPGTQWVPPGYEAQALQEQRAYRGPLEHLPEGAVAVFKGSCDGEAAGVAGGSGRGIVHRSPPIAGQRIQRLLLCLNPPSSASPDRWRRGDPQAFLPSASPRRHSLERMAGAQEA